MNELIILMQFKYLPKFTFINDYYELSKKITYVKCVKKYLQN